ncbi:MAG: hypothetical protein AUK63_2194 [bacterium P3]|nr:MAG: hypothetical protein AUK63_2194 [bacterium P3]KWW31563.1 MAG: hypothetical protein F083_2749 [bacterium F083]
MKRILFVIMVGIAALLSCSSSPDALLTGNDIIDITANKWYASEQFICFDSIGNGWKGDVSTNGDPQHEIDLITQSNFTYSLDTLKKTIKTVNEKDNSSITCQYRLKYENEKRILVLDGVPYTNGDNIYDTMHLGNIGTVAGSILEIIQEITQ